MARRSDHTREELKELVLTTSRAIVEKEGFSALTVRNITSRIGYTVGTLYQMFKNLDDVILHVNAITLDELHEQLKHALNASDAIQRMGECYIAYSRKHFTLWSMLFEHRLAEGGLPDWYQEKINAIFQLIEEALHRETGKDSQTIARAAKILWAGMHGICTLSLSGRLDTVGAESAQTLADNFIHNFITGLKHAH